MPLPPKRAPTLADRFLASGGGYAHKYLEKPYIETLLRKVRAAHKFVFDEEAAERVGHVIRDIPELILREHAFARAPFDLTWIEFPHWKMWQAMGNNAADQDPTADHTLGYLIEGDVASAMTGGTIAHPNLEPLPGIFLYSLNVEWSEADYLEYFKPAGNYDNVDHYLWGTTSQHIPPEMRDELRRRYVVATAPILPDQDATVTRTLLNGALRGSVGELRNIVALLLMLNRPSVTRFSSMPASRGWIRSRNRPYMAHTSVTIDLDAVPTLRLLGTPAGEGVPRRRHEVRGHYCHDRPARDYLRIAGCIHNWAPHREDWTPAQAGEEVNHWVCSSCAGRRWWRAHHERGDAGRGFVDRTTYNVTTRR